LGNFFWSLETFDIVKEELVRVINIQNISELLQHAQLGIDEMIFPSLIALRSWIKKGDGQALAALEQTVENIQDVASFPWRLFDFRGEEKSSDANTQHFEFLH